MIKYVRHLISVAAIVCMAPVLAQDKPNILVIMSDEHNAGVLGCYGNKVIRTANLDELSEYLENGLSGEQRERLTSLPPEQMRQQLWWFYIAAKFPGMSIAK